MSSNSPTSTTNNPLSLEELRNAEKLELLTRRRAVNESQETGSNSDDASKIRPTGLAFSGGGIRAACLALGFTQGLIRNKLTEEGPPDKRTGGKSQSAIAHEGTNDAPSSEGGEVFSWFDYLSTVSGGGYTGSMLSHLVTKCAAMAGKSKEDKRLQALDELDPDKLSIPLMPPVTEKDKGQSEDDSQSKNRPPFWMIFRHRGSMIGKMHVFISRHVVNTFIFNIPMASFQVLLTCSLAFLWRLLDEMPITDYLWWASNHNVRESTRPFLIPIALGYVWVLIAMARPKNSKQGVSLSLLSYSLLPICYFGMPFLLFVSLMLLAVWLIQVRYSPEDNPKGNLGDQVNVHAREKPKWYGMRKTAYAPALLLSLLLIWLATIAHHNSIPVLGWHGSIVGISIIIYGIALLTWPFLINGKLIFTIGMALAVSLYFAIATISSFDIFISDTIVFDPYIQFLLPILILLSLAIALTYIVADNNRGLCRESHQSALISACAMFFGSILVSAAVWLGTPHMNTSSTPNSNMLLDQGYMKYIWPLITALLIPLLKPQDLFRSGQKSAPPTQRWFFNIVSSALLLGVPFVLVYFFAQHNLSGYGSRDNRPWMKHDIEFTKLSKFEEMFDEIVPGAKELHKSMKAERSLSVNRHFPYNDNFLAIPLIYKCDPHGAPLTSLGTRWNDILFRTWRAEREAENARLKLAKDIGDIIQCPVFWTWLCNRCDINFPEKLYYGLLHYGTMDQGKATEIDGYRIRNALKVLGKLDLTVEEMKGRNGFNKLEENLYKIISRRENNVIDIEMANLLFHVGFHDIMSPLGYVRRGIVIEKDQKVRLGIMVASLVIFAMAYCKVNINLVSMQNYYRRQLEDAFLRLPYWHIRKSDVDQASELEDPALELKDVKTTELGFPYHLLHGNIWYCNRQHEPIIVKESFLMSPKYCGSEKLKFIPTEDYVKLFPEPTKNNADGKNLASQFSLADAMSISGAAVTPYQTEGNLLLLAVMTIMNFRTGQWLPNPWKMKEHGAKAVLHPTLKNVRASTVELKTPWKQKSTYKCDMVFVADGGYAENLGVKALFDRRCQLVVGLDSDADPGGEFENLVNLIKQTREDGCQINVNWTLTELASENAAWFSLANQHKNKSQEYSVHKINTYDAVLPARLLEQRYGTVPSPYGCKDDDDSKLEWKQFSSSHFIFFDVEYPDKKKGVFIYVRTSLTGDEPERMLLALRDSVPFPYHPTSEQLYDTKLVELYRELGLHLADRMCFVLNQLNRPKGYELTLRDILMQNSDGQLCAELTERASKAVPK